jgi:CDP-diacylglycerol---serine O-phosphatidyltransferase
VKAYINPANLITSGNLAAGFVALVLAARGELAWAAGLVGAAGVFDALDGLIARHTRCEGTFGSQLDSLADLASFGLAPALILYAGGLASLPVAGIGACLAFVLCGAWRLARFSLVESRYTFVGLPIPPAGLVAALLGAAPVPAPVVCATVVVGAVLMASTLPFPTFAGIAGAFRRPRPREVHLPAPPERGEHAARPSR